MKNLSLAFLILLTIISCTPLETRLAQAQLDLDSVITDMNRLQRVQYTLGDQPADMILSIINKLNDINNVLRSIPKIEKMKEQHRIIYAEIEEKTLRFMATHYRMTVVIPAWRIETIRKSMPKLNTSFTGLAVTIGKIKNSLIQTGLKQISLVEDSELYDTAPQCKIEFKKYGPWSWDSSYQTCSTDSDGNISCHWIYDTDYCYSPDSECGHQLDMVCFYHEMKTIDLISSAFNERDCGKPFRQILKKCLSSRPVYHK